MKTKLFLLAAMATVALTACKRDANPEPEEGAPAVMEIRFGGAETSKAAGAPVVATETAITKGVIFVFRGVSADPALDSKTAFDFTGSTVQPVKVNITQGTRQVYVVANVNPADFTSINNLSDLEHITNKLTLSAFRNHGSLPMSGFFNNVDATTATVAAPIGVTVQLNFIGSRIHVDWDIDNLNPGITGLTINGAMILNVNAKSEYIATSNGSNGYNPLTHNLLDFLQGIGDISSFTGTHLPSVGTTGTTNNYDVELFVPQANKGFDNNYTYVFENGSSKPTIVTIQGTHNSKTYYWPIVINGALNGMGNANGGDLSATVKRGMIYKVKAFIKGLGNEDPYTPINPGALDITILPAAWSPAINIDQEFN